MYNSVKETLIGHSEFGILGVRKLTPITSTSEPRSFTLKFPSTTTRTITSNQTTCKTGWTHYNGNCYRIYDEVKSWSSAYFSCKDVEADLASITSSAEQAWFTAFISEVPRESLWIGLEYDKKELKWTDNSPLMVVYWAPNLVDPKSQNVNSCGFIKSDYFQDPGYWSLSDCYENRLYVCKRKAEIAPDDYQTTPAPGCEKGMIAWRSSCYWFLNDETSAPKATNACLEKQGHLFDIEDLPELYFIKSILHQRQGLKFWTGLNQIRALGIFQWSHGQSLHLNAGQLGLTLSTGYEAKHKALCEKLRFGYTTPIPWGKVEPTTVVSENRLSWNQAEAYCNKYKAHLVSYKSLMEEEKDISLLIKPSRYLSNDDFWLGLKVSPSEKSTGTEYSPAPDIQEHEIIPCPSGEENWYYFNGFCYLHSAAIDDATSWNSAHHSCASKGGNLASIHSTREEDFLIKLPVIEFGYPWIGITFEYQSGKAAWSDNTSVNIQLWNPTESYRDSCGQLNPLTGHWKLYGCNENSFYICKKLSEVIVPTTAKSSPYRPCVTGWYAFGNKCFKFFDHLQTYLMASFWCNGRGSTLASVHSDEEHDFLIALSQGSNEFWIGLNNKNEKSEYYWEDLSDITYAKWASGQPRNMGWSFGEMIKITSKMESKDEGFWIGLSDVTVSNTYSLYHITSLKH
ncbi:C-type mannose receptor 2 [Nymphon striatum]|nr:C-type mannose receptor 2 [Nymphon striatum]